MGNSFDRLNHSFYQSECCTRLGPSGKGVVHFIKRGKTASIKDNLKYLKRCDFDWSKLTAGREKPLVITVLIRQIE